ncbi:FAD-dependent monooxygenase [Shimazuella sp. AN120528]|uniref:FAD-dependent monooxygenase n=1 Tax=Shimazuella soli TaxID=1892854 RepID=UPI001F11445A|nr:FAD-dependent monooxygenase [Shimazuella soli]MCH5583688.1 FAD-dependent monooxygenase [Shimazuella soli]
MNKKILISGASIAGPALAYWLHKYGFQPTIVEKSPILRGGGYKVDIRGVAIKVIEKMGLIQEIRQNDTNMRGGTYVNKENKPLATMSADIFNLRSEGDAEVMRGNLANILYHHTKDDVEYIFGDSISSIAEDDDGVIVTFEKGEPRTFDLVIGADGLHSNVRKLVFGDESPFINHLGFYVATFTIPNYLNLDQWELYFHAPEKVVSIYSTKKQAEAKSFFAFKSPLPSYDHHDKEQQKGLLADAFSGVGWQIPQLLMYMDDTEDFYFDSMSQVEMDHWSIGRTVLLGDAAYCGSPASGQGTSMALVGAYVLAGELASSSGDHHLAFTRYESKMRNFVQKNQQLALDLIDDFIPKSKTQIFFRSQMIRLLPYLPGKKLILGKMLDQVEQAANAIFLEDYT